MSWKHYLHKRMVEARAEKYKIAGKYGVFTAREIDEKYKKEELEEEGTWKDFFNLATWNIKKKRYWNRSIYRRVASYL